MIARPTAVPFLFFVIIAEYPVPCFPGINKPRHQQRRENAKGNHLWPAFFWNFHEL